MNTYKNKPACIMNVYCIRNSVLTSNISFRVYELNNFQVVFCLLILTCFLGDWYTVLCGKKKSIKLKNKNKTNSLSKLGFYTVDVF